MAFCRTVAWVALWVLVMRSGGHGRAFEVLPGGGRAFATLAACEAVQEQVEPITSHAVCVELTRGGGLADPQTHETPATE